MSSLKGAVKVLLRRSGFELRRYTVQTSPDAQLVRSLAHLGIDLVLDVGANAGQYAMSLREHGYRHRVVSFEPSSLAHAALERNAAGDSGWIVAPRMALGATSGVAILNLAGNSVSNSIRGMLPAHVAAAPESAYFGTEEVPLRTLDELAPAYLRQAREVLLKIDTQGFEDAVLKGAEATLPRVRAIQIELSLVPLYEDQILFDETRQRLAARGFELFALYPVYADESTGRTLQLDGLFLRKVPAPS